LKVGNTCKQYNYHSYDKQSTHVCDNFIKEELQQLNVLRIDQQVYASKFINSCIKYAYNSSINQHNTRDKTTSLFPVIITSMQRLQQTQPYTNC